MNWLSLLLATAALLGAALVSGVFFAFSSFVIDALDRIPAAQGMTAMKSINVVVINPTFMGLFLGTLVLSIGVAILSVINHEHPSAMHFLAAALLYVFGTFAVTVFGNVPLNNRLAEVSIPDAQALGFWQHYLDRWAKWNHLRASSAMLAAVMFCLGLVQHGAR